MRDRYYKAPNQKDLFKHVPQPHSTLQRRADLSVPFVKPENFTETEHTTLDKWSAGFDIFARESSSSLSRLFYGLDAKERDAYIDDMVADGRIPQSVANLAVREVGDDWGMGVGNQVHTERDYDQLVEWVNNHTEEKVADEAKLLKIQGEKLEMAQKEMAEISASGGLGDQAILFGGQMLAAIVDPVYAPTYFVGGGFLKAATLAGKFKIFGQMIGTDIAAETFQQVMVKDWKNSIGHEHSYADVAKNVALVAGASTLLNGGAAAMGRAFRAFAKKSRRAGATFEETQPIDDLADDAIRSGDANTIEEVADNLQRATEAELRNGPIGGRITAAAEMYDADVHKQISKMADDMENVDPTPVLAKEAEVNPEQVIEVERYDRATGEVVSETMTVAQAAKADKAIRTSIADAIKCLVGGTATAGA